jgi:hypothetical protein
MLFEHAGVKENVPGIHAEGFNNENFCAANDFSWDVDPK